MSSSSSYINTTTASTLFGAAGKHHGHGATSAATTAIPEAEDKQFWWFRVFLPASIVVFSFAFFFFLQFAVRWYLFGKWTFPTFSYFKIRRFRRSRRSTKEMDSKSLQLIPPNKKWRISNEVVSLIHSGLSGLWSLYLLANFDYNTLDLVDYKNPNAKYLIYMSFGYLVHDFIDLIINERSARIIELIFHHVVVLAGLLVAHLTDKFLYMVIIGLMMEVNSIFLHCRSLMNLYRVSKEATSFKIVALLNVATFILFRMAVSIALICWLVYHYLAGIVAWYLLVFNSLVIYSLFLTNTVLFYRVLAADGLLGKSRTRGAGASALPTVVENNQSAEEENFDEEVDDDDESEENDRGNVNNVVNMDGESRGDTRLAQQEAQPNALTEAATAVSNRGGEEMTANPATANNHTPADQTIVVVSAH